MQLTPSRLAARAQPAFHSCDRNSSTGTPPVPTNCVVADEPNADRKAASPSSDPVLAPVLTSIAVTCEPRTVT